VRDYRALHSVPPKRIELNVAGVWIACCDHEALRHFSLHAHLLGEKQGEDTATEDDGPKEQGRRKNGRIVCREHEVVEEKSEGEVQYEPRPTDEVV